nr:MAG TPA: 43 kDa tail protein [Caudoviricetes sp.]
MTVELIIAEKRTGKIWNASNATTNITYETNRTGSPGTLKFTVLKSGTLSFVEGDIVRFNVDGQLIFYGWVFTKSKDRWGEIDVTCYDRMRYLKANASYSFYGQTAGDIIKQIAEDFQLETADIADTGFAIPSLIETDQSCLDIIQGVVEQTLLNTGKLYIFYDNGDGLCLQLAEDMKSNIMIGDKSLVLDYTYKTDIDEQTYNSVKIAMANEETGKADVYVARDTDNIARWGLLQLYQKVDNDSNSAQLKAQAEATLSYYNRRLRTLKVSSLGVLGLRAGQMILMQIENLGDINLNQWLLIEKITHTFENDKHTMDIELYEI